MGFKRHSYNGDPYWTRARFGSNCARCGAFITKGQDIFYYPRTKSPYGSACGCAEQASNELTCAAEDEAMYCGGTYEY